ncbi:Fe3+/spermidine/putrescine ABC transporter ATP-binding protein, partial [Mesorhizobium sp. M7A.F.Ca.CA.004.08.2.1]
MRSSAPSGSSSRSTAFIHVTHDQEEAMALADHCVV